MRSKGDRAAGPEGSAKLAKHRTLGVSTERTAVVSLVTSGDTFAS
jgi:hypothetical protein